MCRKQRQEKKIEELKTPQEQSKTLLEEEEDDRRIGSAEANIEITE